MVGLQFGMLPVDKPHFTKSPGGTKHNFVSDSFATECSVVVQQRGATHPPAGLVVLVEVAVGDHDALGLPSRAGCVLQIGHALRVLWRVSRHEALRPAHV